MFVELDKYIFMFKRKELHKHYYLTAFATCFVLQPHRKQRKHISAQSPGNPLWCPGSNEPGEQYLDLKYKESSENSKFFLWCKMLKCVMYVQLVWSVRTFEELVAKKYKIRCEQYYFQKFLRHPKFDSRIFSTNAYLHTKLISTGWSRIVLSST